MAGAVKNGGLLMFIAVISMVFESEKVMQCLFWLVLNEDNRSHFVKKYGSI